MNTSSTGKTRALVLSGGGAYGAFEVGALQVLAAAGCSWNIMAGVSVGAINAAYMAMFEPSEQRVGAEGLVRFWERIQGNASIYKPWWCGRLASLWKGGLYNTAPLDGLIRGAYDASKVRASGVTLSVGAVALGSGEYKALSSDEADFPTCVMASAAMPGIFPPVRMQGAAWVDGGVRDATPIRDVLAMAPDAIDVIITGPRGAPPKPSTSQFTNILDVAARSVSLLADEVFQSDLDLCAKLEVPVRVIDPAAHFEHDAFDFDPKHIRALMQQGRERAQRVL